MDRITPTCVGNTPWDWTEASSQEDHPHLRVEYQKHDLQILLIAGSPPLAWGILDHAADEVDHARITPTCVGNTNDGLDMKRQSKDHPHLRGEYP